MLRRRLTSYYGYNMQSSMAPPADDLSILRQSLPEAVANRLRERIIRGEIPEGTVLRQDLIAKQFQVSRIPVREALRQLDAEGLLTIVPHRGALVPELSPGDVEELFRIRALLEPEVLKLSIPRLTNGDFILATKLLQRYTAALREETQVSLWGHLHWQFYEQLYARAELPHFMGIIRNINNKGERYTRLQLYLTRGTQRANREHRQLLDLCKQRNSAAACALLRRHIQFAGESLKQALNEQRTDTKKPASKPRSAHRRGGAAGRT